MRAQVKSFSERSPLVIGAAGIVTVVVMVVGALQYQNLPFLNSGRQYSAYFADAGGLNSGAGVEVSGFVVGNVSSIELDETGVLVKFTIDSDVRLGDRTEAAIKTKSLLGAKIVDVTPRERGTRRAYSARPHGVAVPAARCAR